MHEFMGISILFRLWKMDQTVGSGGSRSDVVMQESMIISNLLDIVRVTNMPF
jgi:hypothetical protein